MRRYVQAVKVEDREAALAGPAPILQLEDWESIQQTCLKQTVAGDAPGFNVL